MVSLVLSWFKIFVMFQFKNYNTVGTVPQPVCHPIIEGAEVFDALCPVSKLTGRRANPLSLLERLANDPVKSRLLQMTLQELPTVVSDPRLSPEDKFELLKSRLSSGTPAEDSNYIRKMSIVLQDYLDMIDSESAPEPAPALAPAPAPEPVPAPGPQNG